VRARASPRKCGRHGDHGSHGSHGSHQGQR
jgi:hypothetical protein